MSLVGWLVDEFANLKCLLVANLASPSTKEWDSSQDRYERVLDVLIKYDDVAWL